MLTQTESALHTMPSSVADSKASGSFSDTESILSPYSVSANDSEEDDLDEAHHAGSSSSAFIRLKSLLQQRDTQLTTDQQSAGEAFSAETDNLEPFAVSSFPEGVIPRSARRSSAIFVLASVTQHPSVLAAMLRAIS